MIWHQETVIVPNSPEGSLVSLVGVYNPPEDRTLGSIIELKVEIISGPDTTTQILTIFEHNPSGLGHQEAPAAEDIFNRYQPKVIKARTRLSSTNFVELATIKRIP